MKKVPIYIILSIFCCMSFNLNAQKSSLDFDGQVTGIASYSRDAEFSYLFGFRYIPELNYFYQIDSLSKFDAQVSWNLSGSAQLNKFEDIEYLGTYDPYRIWLRYSRNQWEIRAGLQKIDFGSAFALRPLQWFNQIDPRDPLQITNGVYGLLGRYYFLNNTNIWLWGLYGNEDRRGIDLLDPDPKVPEYGGRVQFPLKRGEIAFTYHHKRSDYTMLIPVEPAEQVFTEENKFGFDIKLDVEVGLWLESSYSMLKEDLGIFKNQFFNTIGTDYTFGIGNGLNVIVEHMAFNLDEKAFEFKGTGHFTASIISYPITLDDNISSILYYNWKGESLSFFVNYQHNFPTVTAYLMAFYIPDAEFGIVTGDQLNVLSGPGLRIMFVYNH